MILCEQPVRGELEVLGVLEDQQWCCWTRTENQLQQCHRSLNHFDLLSLII